MELLLFADNVVCKDAFASRVVESVCRSQLVYICSRETRIVVNCLLHHSLSNHVPCLQPQPIASHGVSCILLDQAEMVHRADRRSDWQGR
jgi:hypothetical protein